MGPDGKNFHSSDWGPQAAENQAPGPWGAVLTSREEKKTGFGLLPPHQGHPGLGVRATPTVSQRRGCPPPGQGLRRALQEMGPCGAEAWLVGRGV